MFALLLPRMRTQLELGGLLGGLLKWHWLVALINTGLLAYAEVTAGMTHHRQLYTSIYC